MSGFQSSLDIANRALQHLGIERIFSFEDLSPGAREIAFAYDKTRLAELRRNTWRFATRRSILRPRDQNTYQLQPQAWASNLIYGIGSIVSWAGSLYASALNNNVGVQPDMSPSVWPLYFGPLMVSLWEDPLENSNSAYFAGELVYTPQTEGYVVYLSLTTGNSDVPGVFPIWSPTVVYNVGDTISLQPQQLLFVPGNLPISGPGGPLNFVSGIWQSLQDVNVGNQPGPGSTSWVELPITNQPHERNGQNWLQLDARISGIYTPYPLTAGPVTQTITRNAFGLPNGFLRMAPQDPKAGTGVYLGALAGLPITDWTWESNYIVSSQFDPIMLRFVADVSDVTQMDDMFCEGLAARIAKETGPYLLREERDRTIRLGRAERAYQEIMGEARAVNSIEIGWVDPPLDDYIQCRF